MSTDEDWAEKRLQRYKGEGGDGASNNILKTKDGKSIFRILPIPGKTQFFEEIIVHYMDGQPFRCLTTEWFGKDQNMPGRDTECAFCRRWLRELRKINKKYARGSEKSKKAWGAAKKEWAPKSGFYSYAYDTKAEDIEVKIFAYGPMIFGQLLENWVTGGIKFTKIKSGRNVIITKTSKSATDRTMVEYKVIISAKREDITEYWEQLKDNLPDMKEGMPKLMTAEKQEALVAASEIEFEEEEEAPRKKKSRSDVESSEEEEDQDEKDKALLDDEDEDERPKKHKSSPSVAAAKKKLRKSAGEDEESEDEDDEESEDDEEEEERPRSKKVRRNDDIPF